MTLAREKNIRRKKKLKMLKIFKRVVITDAS